MPVLGTAKGRRIGTGLLLAPLRQSRPRLRRTRESRAPPPLQPGRISAPPMHSGSCPAAIATADPLIGKAVWRSGPAAMLAADSRPGPRLSGKIPDVHPHQKRQESVSRGLTISWVPGQSDWCTRVRWGAPSWLGTAAGELVVMLGLAVFGAGCERN